MCILHVLLATYENISYVDDIDLLFTEYIKVSSNHLFFISVDFL